MGRNERVGRSSLSEPTAFSSIREDGRSGDRGRERLDMFLPPQKVDEALARMNARARARREKPEDLMLGLREGVALASDLTRGGGEDGRVEGRVELEKG